MTARVWMVVCGLVTAACGMLQAPPEQPLPAPSAVAASGPLYDESADGEQQIAAALATAKRERKRVLLQFGANWCGWCHRLHALYASDPAIAGRLRQDYVVVLIDVSRGHNAALDQRLGRPSRLGLPVLVVLDADGRAVVTQETGSFEDGDHHHAGRVLIFLERWVTPT